MTNKLTSYQRLKNENAKLKEQYQKLLNDFIGYIDNPHSVNSLMIKADLNFKRKIEKQLWMGIIN